MGSCHVEGLREEARNAHQFAMTSMISINDFHRVFHLIFVIGIEWIGMLEDSFPIALLFMRLDKEGLASLDGKLEVLIKHRKRIEINIQTRIVMEVLFVWHVHLACIEIVNNFLLLLKQPKNGYVSCVQKECIQISLVHPYVENVLSTKRQEDWAQEKQKTAIMPSKN